MKKAIAFNIGCAVWSLLIGMSRIEDMFIQSGMKISRVDFVLTGGCFFFVGAALTMAFFLWDDLK
jgi:ABC-type proline/glycine betaine transport system permease subunit